MPWERPRERGSRTGCRLGRGGSSGLAGAIAGRPPLPPFHPSFLLFLTKVVSNVSLQRKNNNANEKDCSLFLIKLSH